MADEGIFPKIPGDAWHSSELNTVNYGNFEAGENLTAGNVVFIKKNDGEVYVGDTETADDIRADGIVVSTVTTGNTAKVILRGNYTTSGLTAKEVYYLGASGAISTTVSAVQVGIATSITNLFIDVKQDDSDPIGTVKHILANITGVPTYNISAFWVLADGTTISDAESPLNGQVIRDLNGNNEFLRSADTAGGNGGGTHNHQVFIENAVESKISINAPGGKTGTITSQGYDTNGSAIDFGSDARTTGLTGDYYTTKVDGSPPYYDAVAIVKIK